MSHIRRAALLFAAIACAPVGTEAAAPAMVRLALGDGLAAMPAIVAQERGFFAQENLVVSGLGLGSPKSAAASLAAGTSDFATVEQSSLLAMRTLGAPVKVVALSHWDAAVDLVVPVRAEAPATLGDLVGRRVAVADTASYAILARLLNAAGLRPQEVEVLILKWGEAAQAFTDGTADAFIGPRALSAPLLEGNAARRLVAHEQIVERLGITGAQPLLVRAEMLETQPEVVQRFLNAWVKALVYINQDLDDAAGLFQIYQHRQGVRMARKHAHAWVSASRFDRYEWAPEDTQDLTYNGWALIETGLLPDLPELGDLADNRFAARAWQSLQ